jgi:arsenate reductase (glutaredoxin)
VEVQIFGVVNHTDVRKAQRFFKERRVKVHFVDFKIRGPALGELRRFADKFGVTALIDRQSKRYAALGLGPARYSDAKWLDLLVDEPLLLTMPLVRYGSKVTVGLNEAAWAEWVASA